MRTVHLAATSSTKHVESAPEHHAAAGRDLCNGVCMCVGEQVRQLQPSGVAAWWHMGHPGWAIYPVDSDQFLSTGALDGVNAQAEHIVAPLPPSPSHEGAPCCHATCVQCLLQLGGSRVCVVRCLELYVVSYAVLQHLMLLAVGWKLMRIRPCDCFL